MKKRKVGPRYTSATFFLRACSPRFLVVYLFLLPVCLTYLSGLPELIKHPRPPHFLHFFFFLVFFVTFLLLPSPSFFLLSRSPLYIPLSYYHLHTTLALFFCTFFFLTTNHPSCSFALLHSSPHSSPPPACLLHSLLDHPFLSQMASSNLKTDFLNSRVSAGYNPAVETIRKVQYPQLKGILAPPSFTHSHSFIVLQRTIRIKS